MLFSPQIISASRRVVAAAGGGGGATTWNPLDINNVTLSGGNLVATATAGGAGARTIASVVTNQKVYAEFVPTVAANDQRFGFATATHANGAGLGSNESGVSQSFGVQYLGAYLDFSSADNSAAMPTFTTGDRVDIAYDDGAKRFWSRVNGGAWSNSGDPAAGTGGRVVSVAGTLFGALSIGFSTEVTTARFSSGSWVGTPPAGYTQLA